MATAHLVTGSDLSGELCMNENGTYSSFLIQNRRSINKTLNKVLWICLLIAPSIALGIFTGSFPNATYRACLIIFAAILILALIHSLMLKKWPDSVYTSHFILLSLDMVLVQMAYFRINIHITWFFIPLLSILFCNTAFYISTVIINYFFLILSVYLMAPHYSALRTDYDTVREYFFNVMGGYTIETMIMAIAGYAICKYITRYLRQILDENNTIRENQQKMTDQLRIQESMAKIYDTVNIIDFDKMTEKSLSELDSSEYSIEGHAHSRMNHMIRKKVIPEQYEAFSDFTDITTIRDRLVGKKSIYAEFIHIDTGWFRAQYIPLDEGEDLRPHKIIYTTQTIDDTKKKEEYLTRISTTDELTSLYNRRSYDQDMAKYSSQEIKDDLVVISIDINGLKEANDTKGHSAGDELIKGAADCIL
jgi:predicted signal transduction protein with EAL and GGDEF domain